MRQSSIPSSWLLIGVFAVVALMATWGNASTDQAGMTTARRRAVRAASISRRFRGRRRSRRPPRVRPPGPAARRRSPPQTPPGNLPPGQMEACNGARIVAYVGPDAILESDLILRKMDEKGTFEIIGSVDHVVDQYRDKYPPDQLNSQREALIAKVLPEVVEIKLIYLDAKQTIPSEHWPNVEKQLGGASRKCN